MLCQFPTGTPAADTHLPSVIRRLDDLGPQPPASSRRWTSFYTPPHHKEFRLGTVGLLELSHDTLRAEIVVLGQSNGSPNPGLAQRITVSRDGSITEEARPAGCLSRRL